MINKLIALLILIILFPLFILIAVLIKVSDNGPIFYWSERIGKNNQKFWMPKFRTMRTDTPVVATHLLKASSNHIFPFGNFLRKSSFDEIPQLLSILKGDMNFIGPRPALFNQLDLIELRTQKNIHLINPGLTGWAQVNGRDDLSIDKKVSYDQEYLRKKSLLFDSLIIFLTIKKVLFARDISH